MAHDERKQDLLEWAKHNINVLEKHDIVATGTTGKIIADNCDLPVKRNGDLDILIFFWDPMAAQPHDVVVKALLRMSVLYNIPTACNRSTADFIISSKLFQNSYSPQLKYYKHFFQQKL